VIWGARGELCEGLDDEVLSLVRVGDLGAVEGGGGDEVALHFNLKDGVDGHGVQKRRTWSRAHGLES
jgi:hypothetical protein